MCQHDIIVSHIMSFSFRTRLWLVDNVIMKNVLNQPWILIKDFYIIFALIKIILFIKIILCYWSTLILCRDISYPVVLLKHYLTAVFVKCTFIKTVDLRWILFQYYWCHLLRYLLHKPFLLLLVLFPISKCSIFTILMNVDFREFRENFP